MNYWNKMGFGLIGCQFYGSFGVYKDGTVAVAGESDPEWMNIVQVGCGERHSLGLRADGTVLGNGVTRDNRREGVESWTNVVQLAAGSTHSLGLRSNGTVWHTGGTGSQPEIDQWTDIVHVACGSFHSLGVKSDGTVIGAGSSSTGRLNVDQWTDIIQVAAGDDFSAGLKADGTVVAVGDNLSTSFLNEIAQWENIIQIASLARSDEISGLKADGTVVQTGSLVGLNDFENIIQIARGPGHILGLRADGTVATAGSTSSDRLDGVDSWELTIGQYYEIEGITTIDGVPASMELRAYEAQAGGIQIKGQSDATGAYTLKLPRWFNAYVMTVPPPGHRPEVHGPIIRPDELDITPAP